MSPQRGMVASHSQIELRTAALALRMASDASLVRSHRFMPRLFPASFKGCDGVSWLVHRGEAASREEAAQLCGRMLMLGLCHHVCREHLFYDTNEYL